ncbi:MAG TPA: galactokinase [Actinomycetota bacterium]|nr:galactokinase [Actinomycetota bacterium]
MNDTAARAAEAFAQRFGARPDGVWRAPGRANLIGEHTDYTDGFVMPFAIDRAAFAAVALRDDGLVQCASSAFGDAQTLDVADLAPDRTSGWAAYVHGAIVETAGALELRGMDVFVHSDVPAGAGLSSSAALECAVATAVAELHQLKLSRRDLALAAQRAEHRFAGVPCGIMDQMASMFGRRGHALLIDTRSLEISPIPLDISGHALLVIDTRIRHALADGAYADRRRACEEAALMLGVAALRDVTPAQVEASALEDVLLRRARHVVTENARVIDAAEALRAGSVARLARSMLSSHVSLRDDFEVSSAELDAAVESALDAGAVAARMTGAGFGGSVIALIPDDARRSVREAVRGTFAKRGFVEPAFVDVAPADGAARAL